MKAKMQLDGTEKVTIEAADRNNEDRTLRNMKFITRHDTNEDRVDLAKAIYQDLTALLRFYPDTRKGKSDAKERKESA